jgi:hypothetical protein
MGWRLLVLGQLALAAGVWPAYAFHAIDPTRIPIGDGKVTTAGPRRGYIYLCVTPPAGGGGAPVNGPWIHADGTYDLTAKAVVDGDVDWPDAFVAITRDGPVRTIRGNGLPTDHGTGSFPVAPTDDAFRYDPNPNTIHAQTDDHSITARPRKGPPRCLGTPATGSDVGVAVDGVRIFDGTDALQRDAVAHETQDACGGHPERTGRYHYHSIPSCLTASESEHAHSGIVGWAFDGFPIAGPRGAHGRLLTNADLDVCHGHTHRLRVDGKLVRTYHYHATLEFPYTVGCFRGVQ